MSGPGILRCSHQQPTSHQFQSCALEFLQVEQQIKANRLSFKENSFLDDAALRKKAVRAIMSYHPLWLRLGIDTVLNRRTFQEGDLDNIGAVSSADLEAVVREELLSDTTLLVRCALPCFRLACNPYLSCSALLHCAARPVSVTVSVLSSCSG